MFGSEEEVRLLIRVVSGQKRSDKTRQQQQTITLEDPELICLTSKTESRIMIQRIKYSHGTYSIAATWQADDLKSVNPEEHSVRILPENGDRNIYPLITQCRTLDLC